MSTLTGQQIKNTYQGLLKLEDSTSGITSNFQQIQDGLGNNTGLRIATNQLEGPGIPSFVPLKAQYYGAGFLNVAGQQYSSGIQNTIIATPFYDGGEYSYSAITFNTQTITSTSDTIEAAIYTSQMINPYGIYPYAPIVSGITEYGVFVEIGMLAGLIYKTNMGELTPESFTLAQEVEVEIIDIDFEKSRLSLAFRG